MKKPFFKQRDKQLHLALTAIGVLVLVLMFRVDPNLSALAILVASIGKEFLYDKVMAKGHPSLEDVYANTIGTVTGYFLSYVIMYLYVSIH